MVALDFSFCEEAEPYYYDFLYKEDSKKAIPELVIDHIKHCPRCQGQLNRLTRVLSLAEGHIETAEVQVSSVITTMLRLHLAYIGKPVTCETAKPFLPSMLDPAFEIGIPTPITVHLDNCQKCAEDLETIRMLNLDRKQLRRLSQLFADKAAGSNIGCTEARNAVPSFVSMVFSETDLEVVKHLCVCPDCRGLVYQRREMVLRGLQKTSLVEDKFPCKQVSAGDFFDYVMPYGIDHDNDQYTKFRESLTSHLRICPNCLAKMQELHKTIYGICEQAESEVITVYHIDETSKVQALNQPDAPYAGFPIRVEVSGGEEAETEAVSATIDFGTVLKQKEPAASIKPLFKIGVAAAAVIFIAAALLLNIPTAKAVSLRQIYKAIEGVKNIYISSFVPGRTKPIQERWISRTANAYLLKTEKESVLWDIDKGVRTSKQTDTTVTETVSLTDVLIADAERKITGSLGLMPFYDISDVPEEVEWSRASDKDFEVAQDIEVYDLTWTEKAYDGSTLLKKWRVFADSETNFPQRIEWYEKLTAHSEYTLSLVMEVEYLSDEEIQENIKKASF